MPRACLDDGDGKTEEWKSKALRAYQRRTKAADALIASVYLSGTNTRRVRRALAALFGDAIGKDVVSRPWRKVRTDWDAWNARSLADEPIVRLILDGTVVRVRLDRKATSISLLVVIGVREDGQKVLLVIGQAVLQYLLSVEDPLDIVGPGAGKGGTRDSVQIAVASGHRLQKNPKLEVLRKIIAAEGRSIVRDEIPVRMHQENLHRGIRFNSRS